ncbi:hypothetical protein ANO11243_063750 [Dothideomycetidae sp. 11243]|nr:hypothetical protein ANO11243_063750 [fungal sp. No.11243]
MNRVVPYGGASRGAPRGAARGAVRSSIAAGLGYPPSQVEYRLCNTIPFHCLKLNDIELFLQAGLHLLTQIERLNKESVSITTDSQKTKMTSSSPSEKPNLNAIDDPSDPSRDNDDHTSAKGLKPQTILEAVTDPSLKPTIENAGPVRKILSYGVLLSLVGGLMSVAYLSGMELFQSPLGLVGIGGGTFALLLFAGSDEVDYFELVTQYWFLVLPVALGVVFFYALLDDNAREAHKGGP